MGGLLTSLYYAINRKLKNRLRAVGERNFKPRKAGRKYNSPRWSCVSSVTLGISEKGIGVRRSGAEEADSSRAPSIPRKLLALIQIKSAPVPARSVASLRSSPLSVGLRSGANAPALRARILGGEPTGGFVAARLHHRLLSFAPIGASNSARWRSQIIPPLQLPIYRAF